MPSTGNAASSQRQWPRSLTRKRRFRGQFRDSHAPAPRISAIPGEASAADGSCGASHADGGLGAPIRKETPIRYEWMVLAGLVTLMLQSGGAAAVLHVSAHGSDESRGTEDAPWATLQHAVDAAGPGDTILVGPGRYAGCVICRSGTTEAPIVLKAEGPGVHVDRPGPENRRQSIIEVGTHREVISHWVVDGFEVSGARRWGINVGRTEHVTVQKCRVHDCGLTGIFTAFSDDVTIQFNESYDNREHGIYHSNSGDYPVIRGNRCHHNDGCGIHMNGDLNMGGDGLVSHGVVERNIVWENGRAGGSAINCDGVSDSVIRNNLCYDNHASGISLYAIDAAEGSSRNEVSHNTVVMGPDGRWVLNIPWWQPRPPPVGNRRRDLPHGCRAREARKRCLRDTGTRFPSSGVGQY